MPTMDEEHVEFEIQENTQKRISGSTLDHFTFICHNKEAIRLKNGILLLKHLLRNSEAENESREVKYALNRLLRGLGAKTNTSRVGNYSTLVALLDTIPSLNIEQVLECMNTQLQIGSTSFKSEIGEIYTGQVLACGALLRSGMFLKGTVEEQKSILDILLNAGKQRSYLALATSSFIAELLSMVDEDQFEASIWPSLKSEILKPWPQQTLDSIYLFILVRNKFPQVLKGGALKKTIGSREILSAENVKSLCDILLNIPSISFLKHSAYAAISKEIATSDIILAFVTQLDEQLTNLNRNKLLAVSIILRHILPDLQDSSHIPELLTKNFIKETLQYYRNHLNNNHDQEFQETMSKFFDTLCNRLENDDVDDKIKISVLKTLLFYPGSFMIENITKSKMLQQLMRALNSEGVKKLSKLYKDVLIAKKEKVMDDNVTEPWLNSERIYAAQLLTKLLSHPAVKNELEWKAENLKLLLNLGIVNHEKYANVGGELAGGIRDIFFRALDQKFPKLENMSSILLELTNHLESLITVKNFDHILRVSFEEEEFDILQQMYTITKQLETKKAKNKYALVFQILFLHMGLQLFKDKELAVASLKELFMCYERVKHDKKSKTLESDESNDPEWIEVVVDLFLNLLSHNSHLFRNVINCVFPHLCEYMTPSSVHQILSVLDPRNETNPLSNAHDSDESNDDEDEDDDENAENESDNDESDNESEFEENETVNDKLRMAVRQALGNNGYQTDEESIDLDDMSDTEGERLDGALAQAFKQFKPNRGKNNKKQTKDAQILTHFRVRVLDLVEIYLDSEPAMLSCLEIMLPLLQTLEFTVKDEHQTPLQIRVKNCLKKLTSLKKFGSIDGITENVLGDLLGSLMDKGTKSAMMIQEMSTELSECCMFIIKCSQILNSMDNVPKKTKRKLKEKIIEILTNAVKQYFNQRDCLIPYCLFKCMFQLNWDGNLVLAPLVFEFVSNDGMRPFRRSQGLELLKLFYLNRRIQGMEEAFQMRMNEPEKQFCNTVVNMLNKFCENPNNNIKERVIYHIFNLLKAIASHPIKNEEIDWKLLGEKVHEYRSYVTLSKDAKKAYNQLCAQLKIPNVVCMKNQTVKIADDQHDEFKDLNNPATSEGKQKRKGKATQQSKKLKKEAQALRFQSLSEGLPSYFSFSSVNINDVRKKSIELSDEENKKKKQKHKTINNEDSKYENACNGQIDTSTTKISKKDRNKRLPNGDASFNDTSSTEQTGKNKIKKSKKRLSNNQETQSYETSPCKKKKHN